MVPEPNDQNLVEGTGTWKEPEPFTVTQLSNCAVERVFSQLNLIRESCGDNMMEDMLQIRMFERCNGELSDLFDELFY